MTDEPTIELMGVSEAHKALIHEACTGATGSIYLKDLDKGLSGARVLLAHWPLEAETESAFHVLKIGKLDKLQLEIDRIEQFVAPVDPQIGHIRLFPSLQDSELGLLRQAFLGGRDGTLKSLRRWIDEVQKTQTVVKQIATLFERRMLQWHCRTGSVPPHVEQTLDQIFEDRTARIKDLPTLFDDIGLSALETSFKDKNLATAKQIYETVATLRSERGSFASGLVHGDLHAQNVLVGNDDELHLIDFAWAGYNWKAVDFLMMECSLKFIVTPHDFRVEDLIEMERLLDGGEEKAAAHFKPLGERVYGQSLQVFASAVNEVRRQSMRHRAIRDFDQYRRGLIVLTACLASYPELNRNFLAHSLAFHVSRLS